MEGMCNGEKNKPKSATKALVLIVLALVLLISTLSLFLIRNAKEQHQVTTPRENAFPIGQ